MVDKKKTKTKKKTLDPIFNETFIFELPKCQKSMKLNFIVMDWDLMPPDEVSLKFIILV